MPPETDLAPAPDLAAPTPEPSPTPAPAAEPTPSTVKPWDAGLEELSEGPPEATPTAAPAAPEPKPEPAKKDAKTPAPAPPKPEPSKPAATPRDKDGIPAFQTNKDLRKWAEEQHRQARALATEKATLEAKLKEVEQIVPKTQQESTLMGKTVAQMQQQIQQYEQALAIHVFEQSPKYMNEFRKPYQTALEKAYREVTELLVSEPTGEEDEDGKPKMRQRPATKRDFDYIYSLPRAQARQAAKQMFGDDASDVMEHRRAVSDLAEKAIQAVEDHKKSYRETMEAEMGRQTQQRQAIGDLWRTSNEKISSDPKFAWLWGEDKEDAQANAELAKGFQMADLFFSEERDKMDPKDKVLFDANIRHRIASFSKLAYQVKALKQAVQERDATIAELRGSSPGKPMPDAGAQAPNKDPWDLNQLPE